MTFNRAMLEHRSSPYSNQISDTRKRNYQGHTYQKFTDVITDVFGERSQIPYSSSGGYQNKGGYVVYFNDTITYSEAMDIFYDLCKDGLFDLNLLSITLEVMAYNQNYQIGAILAYEFLVNNGGQIDMYTHRSSFSYSRYKNHYNQHTKSYTNFLILIDIVYFLITLIYTYYTFKKLYKRLVDALRLRLYHISPYEVFDF